MSDIRDLGEELHEESELGALLYEQILDVINSFDIPPTTAILGLTTTLAQVCCNTDQDPERLAEYAHHCVLMAIKGIKFHRGGRDA